MLYSGTSVTLLIGRIGWDVTIPPSPITVSNDNKASASGRFFNSFHQLVTAENVNDSVNNLKIAETDLNVYLAKMKKDSVLEVLNKLFDTNILAIYQKTEEVYSVNYDASGYDSLIEANITVFDQAIGYSMAVRAVQLFITSERSNGAQRKMKQSYDFLKSELEGIKDKDGNVLAVGVNSLFDISIQDANKVLFPTNSLTKPTLTARNYW